MAKENQAILGLSYAAYIIFSAGTATFSRLVFLDDNGREVQQAAAITLPLGAVFLMLSSTLDTCKIIEKKSPLVSMPNIISGALFLTSTILAVIKKRDIEHDLFAAAGVSFFVSRIFVFLVTKPHDSFELVGYQNPVLNNKKVAAELFGLISAIAVCIGSILTLINIFESTDDNTTAEAIPYVSFGSSAAIYSVVCLIKVSKILKSSDSAVVDAVPLFDSSGRQPLINIDTDVNSLSGFH
jgi:hypothetical protein